MDCESGHNVASADFGSAGEAGAMLRRPKARSNRFLRPSWSPARAAFSDRPSRPRSEPAATMSACWRGDRARARISIPADRCARATCSIAPRLAAALKGVRFLFHAAADYRLWSPDPDEIQRNNVEGTRLIMEEALRAGVERIVYTSSVATLSSRTAPRRTRSSSRRRRGDRRLQAQQGRGRASGRGDGRAGMACRR